MASINKVSTLVCVGRKCQIKNTLYFWLIKHEKEVLF